MAKLRREPKTCLARVTACMGIVAAVAVACIGCGREAACPLTPEVGPSPTPEGEQIMSFQLSTSAFESGGRIPTRHTADGADVSPPLAWTDPPEGTRSFALVCDDPDAPMGTWVHWVVYAIPADARELAEGIPAKDELENGTRQGTNDFRKVGYGGPSPPPGRAHRYYFRLYALDAALDLPPRQTKTALMKAMEGHILGEAELMGKYGR